MDYEVKDFKKEVLDRSFRIPVLVDFWAEWCRPCKILAPVLEKLASGQEQWVLVKVDTEINRNIALKYKVSSIPNVKLFIDGRVTDQFMGALPEAAILQWLEKAVPGKFDKKLKEAQNLLSLQQDKAARILLEDILTQQPGNTLAKVLLARTFLLENWAKAAEIIEGVKSDPAYSNFLELVQTMISLFKTGERPENLPENPAKALYLQGIKEASEGHFDPALDSFISAFELDKEYDRGGAKRACIALFQFLGESNAVTKKHRRRFSSALYA